jgi:hypothetical protein
MLILMSDESFTYLEVIGSLVEERNCAQPPIDHTTRCPWHVRTYTVKFQLSVATVKPLRHPAAQRTAEGHRQGKDPTSSQHKLHSARQARHPHSKGCGKSGLTIGAALRGPRHWGQSESWQWFEDNYTRDTPVRSLSLLCHNVST